MLPIMVWQDQRLKHTSHSSLPVRWYSKEDGTNWQILKSWAGGLEWRYFTIQTLILVGSVIGGLWWMLCRCLLSAHIPSFGRWSSSINFLCGIELSCGHMPMLLRKVMLKGSLPILKAPSWLVAPPGLRVSALPWLDYICKVVSLSRNSYYEQGCSNGHSSPCRYNEA